MQSMYLLRIRGVQLEVKSMSFVSSWHIANDLRVEAGEVSR